MPTADLGDVRIHYQRRGEGPPVLGIMGFGLDQRFWAGQIPVVTATHSFVTFDNRGLGRSSGGTPPASISDMAGDAVGLLDHLGIEDAVVFGVSMGGAIAQRIALDHPRRVSALILGMTWARPIEFMRRQHGAVEVLLRAGAPETFIDATLVRMFTPLFFELGRDSIDRMMASFFATGAPELADREVLLAQLDAIDKHDCLFELGTISVPTLVLGGRADTMVPFFASEEIAAAIPGAELVAFDTGHACMVEEMPEFNERVSEFLKRL